MKTLLAIIITLISIDVEATSSFTVKGKLVVDQSSNLQKNIYIKTVLGNIKLNNQEDIQNCTNGIYKLGNQSNNQYDLLKIVSCDSYDLKEEDTLKMNLLSDDDAYNCPKIYKPVCGRTQNPNCLAGLECNEEGRFNRTYSNICQLKRDKATHLFNGTCNTALGVSFSRELPAYKFLR